MVSSLRPIEIRAAKNADVIIFTDGFTPDPRKNEKLADRVGGVIFDRRQMAPSQFTAVVPKHVQKKWIPRKTQIVLVEMVAPLIALETFKDRLFGADIILLIDSEAVEAALVKGYSSKEDLCELISVFWNQVFDLQARVLSIDLLLMPIRLIGPPGIISRSVKRPVGNLFKQFGRPHCSLSE